MTVTRWCESGKLPALSKPFGKRATYQISPSAVQMLLTTEQHRQTIKEKPERLVKNQALPHKEFVSGWSKAMQQGLLTGRVFSPRTVQLYKDYADEFFGKVSYLSSVALEQALGRIPAESISKRQNFYKALLCLSKYLIKQQVLEPEFVEQVKPLFPKRHLPPKRLTITTDELDSLLKVCESLQDRTLLQTLASTGLRNAELCALNVADLNLIEGWLEVRKGKGGKRRRVGLMPGVIALLKEYLQSHDREGHAPLFLNTKGKRMDISGLFQRIQRIGNKAGITANPHALRRAFVTINANKGRPLQMLQMACGHSDIKTTMGYCRTQEQEVIEAMKGWN